ncbi:nonsense-mediated mRNA decay protein 2 [Punica granatum]|uniref:Uncharacterized protein n=2 Tax=Punica granatum TaxID=22663 RepID=A0A218XMA3_PUNGR|nr:nonsense-mediated mRNA decay protein 2 [Punica granatum]OWM85806.1 hypothetical protein CDL15_Pgr012056 [Punica granatum]PKI77515.1 hypothetical protein CRG98_002121 [Punica granatum]
MEQTNVFSSLKLIQTAKHQILRKVSIKQLFMLLSVSLFSLVFSSSNCPSFLKAFNFDISTFPFRLFTHAVDKNCIFLICNGILVFLAKSSGLIKGSRTFRKGRKQAESLSFDMKAAQAFEYTDEHLSGGLRGSDDLVPVNTDRYSVKEVKRENEDDLDEASEVSKAEEEASAVVASGEEHHSIEEHENCAVSIEEDYGFDDQIGDDHRDDDQMEEQGEEEEDDVFGNKTTNLSMEELNKKFEEFIRRMKEEIKIEDQQQLAAV